MSDEEKEKKDKEQEFFEFPKDLNQFIAKNFQHPWMAKPGQEPAGDDDPGTSGLEDIRFDMKPEELLAYLNEYVIRQDEAKAILATKVCTHFNRIRVDLDEESPVGVVKNNIIMMGPTGVGKTYIVRLIANKLGVPFVKADATKFSETGYVGGDVEDLVRDLVRQAGGNIEVAQYGIVYVDEIDKIASTGKEVGPDVSRSGVQRNLLKLLEETEVDLRSPFDLASQVERMFEAQRTGKAGQSKVNTKNILFIVSGAFYGLEDIVLRRLKQRDIGFHTQRAGEEPSDRMEILKLAGAEDLIEYGFESEFIGRLPVTAVLHHLGVDDLYRILKNRNSTIMLSKKRDFKAYGIEIEFDDDALEVFARFAAEEKTGARGLISAMEKVLLRFETKLPSTDIRKFRITKKVVENPERELRILLSQSARRAFSEKFQREHGIRIEFTDDALDEVERLAEEKGVRIDLLCDGLFRDYGHGLRLIDAQTFTVTKDIVEHPREYLDNLIQKHYEKQK